MPLMQSAMVPLGTAMPAFSLPDVVSGATIDSAALDAGKPVLVLFICVHCPFTKRIVPAMARAIRTYRDRVSIVAISANDPEQVPEDAPEGLKRLAAALDFEGPFCFDASQEVARAFDARCTPECFLYNRERRLVYRGEIATSTPGSPASTSSIEDALDALLTTGEVPPSNRPGSGCNVKWRAATSSRLAAPAF